MMERGRKINGVDREGFGRVNFQEELQMIKERRQNYLNDTNNETEQKRKELRKEIKEVQEKMIKFDYQDVREELDILLGEYGLSELQKQSFEEMMLLTADLRDLLDGSNEVPEKVFQKIDKNRTLRNTSKLLKGVSAMNFSEKFNKMRNEFINEMSTRYDPLVEEQKELKQFEKDLQFIYFGKILDSAVIKDFIQLHFDSVRARPNDFENDFLHIYTMDNKQFIKKGDQKKIFKELYNQSDFVEKELEIIRETERDMINEEAFKDKTFKNLALEKRVNEFYLRDGVPVGLLRLKNDIKMDKVEAQELVDLLNYNDLEFEYEAVQDDLEEFFLIRKLRGFRFNVNKYLFFLEEKDKLAEEVCKVLEVSFDDYLRLEMGLKCSSQANEDKIRNHVLRNSDFLNGVEDLEKEFFGENELKIIKNLTQDIIDEEIMKYKAHILMRSRLTKLNQDDITRPIRHKEVVTSANGKINYPDYDIIVNN
jgi:hypothetical protein